MEEIRIPGLSATLKNKTRVGVTYIGTSDELSSMTDMVPGDVFIVADGDRLKTKHMYTGITWQLVDIIYPDKYVSDIYELDFGLGIDNEKEIIIEATTKILKVSINVYIEGKARVQSFQNFTTTDDGTPVITFNREVNGENTSALIYEDPAIAQDGYGEKRGDILIPAGKGGTATGGSTRGDNYSWIHPGERLLFILINNSGQVRDASISIDIEEIDVV